MSSYECVVGGYINAGEQEKAASVTREMKDIMHIKLGGRLSEGQLLPETPEFPVADAVSVKISVPHCH